MSTKESPTPPTQEKIRRDDFVERYANNVQFEIGNFDMSMIFGIGRGTTTLQHTEIIVSLTEAKLIAFYMWANIAIIESRQGQIPVPAGLRPRLPEATEESPEILASIKTAFASLFGPETPND